MPSSPPALAGEQAPSLRPTQRSGARRRLVLTVLAVRRVRCCAARPRTGRSDPVRPAARLQHRFRRAREASRSVILTPRNLGLAAAMVAAFAWFWLWHLDLTESTLVVIGRGADGPAARAPGVRRRRGAWSHRRGHEAQPHPGASGGWWSSSTSTTRTGRASTCWRRCVSSCRWCWRRRGRGAPAGGRIELGLLRHPLRRRGAAPPAAGPQHLAVLPAARWSPGRRWRALRADRVLLERRPVRRRDRRLRRRPGPAGGVGARPSPTRLRGHQRGRGPAVGLPRCPARPGIRCRPPMRSCSTRH